MITFYNKDQEYFLTTNTKVLSSSLRKQKNLERVGNFPVWLHTLSRRLGLSRMPHYFLVRNPYARVESFFKEKLRKCIHQTTDNPPYILKLHQQIFYPYIGVREGDDLEEIKRKFFALTFGEYVSLLPRVYFLDAHLRPQSWSRKRKLKGVLPFTILFDRVMKIEEASTFEFLGRELKLDTGIRANATVDKRNEIRWTEAELRIVNKIYKVDFELFGYELNEIPKAHWKA